ncbi:hypothetical protein GGD62_005771 [Bradyrhizobium sp. ERR14]|nr:hypothetical protein [Bradyrhizobium sp. ERR14]
MVSRASRHSPLCHAPLTSLPATASICCAGHAQQEETGHAEVLHSSCQVMDGISHRFCVLFVDFPTGRSRCFLSALSSAAYASSSRDGLVRYRCQNVRFDLCHAFGHLRPMGHGAFGAPSRHAALREQPQSGALCTRRPTTRSRSSPPSILSLAELQINVLAGYVAGLASWGLFNTDPVGREGDWMVDVLKNRWEAGDAFCSRWQSRPAQAAFVPIWRAARGQLRWSFRYRRLKALLHHLNVMHGDSRSRCRSISVRHNLRG